MHGEHHLPRAGGRAPTERSVSRARVPPQVPALEGEANPQRRAERRAARQRQIEQLGQVAQQFRPGEGGDEAGTRMRARGRRRAPSTRRSASAKAAKVEAKAKATAKATATATKTATATATTTTTKRSIGPNQIKPKKY